MNVFDEFNVLGLLKPSQEAPINGYSFLQLDCITAFIETTSGSIKIFITNTS